MISCTFTKREYLKRVIRTDRHGSSTVFLAIAFLAFAFCIAGGIGISRKLTVMSTCESYGRVWTRAILSEYDLHLLEDYGLMAYWGNEIEVNRKIDDYLEHFPRRAAIERAIEKEVF